MLLFKPLSAFYYKFPVPHIISCKWQAHANTVSHVGSSLSQRNHANSGMCRWDSDDLSEISDDEWDDDA